MDTATQRALAAHNRRFYDANARAFSDTRNHAWPGWRRVIEGLGAARELVEAARPGGGDELRDIDGARAGGGRGLLEDARSGGGDRVRAVTRHGGGNRPHGGAGSGENGDVREGAWLRGSNRSAEGTQLGGSRGLGAGARVGADDRLSGSLGLGKGVPLGTATWPGAGAQLGSNGELRGDSGDRARPGLRVLDAGCGNGRLACFLREQLAARIEYTGVDACRALLEAARVRLGDDASLLEHDLVDEPLARALPDGRFDLVCAFGVLHHIPGFERRRELVEALAGRVARGGRLALAFWRFAERERFRKRLLDWSAAPEIDRSRLERGDLLLAWGEAGAARYCHASDDEEIEALLERVALVRTDDFEADGRGGDLNRYIVCELRGG